MAGDHSRPCSLQGRQRNKCGRRPGLRFQKRLAVLHRVCVRFVADKTALPELMSTRRYDTRPDEGLATAVDCAGAFLR